MEVSGSSGGSPVRAAADCVPPQYAVRYLPCHRLCEEQEGVLDDVYLRLCEEVARAKEAAAQRNAKWDSDKLGDPGSWAFWEERIDPEGSGWGANIRWLEHSQRMRESVLDAWSGHYGVLIDGGGEDKDKRRMKRREEVSCWFVLDIHTTNFYVGTSFTPSAVPQTLTG